MNRQVRNRPGFDGSHDLRVSVSACDIEVLAELVGTLGIHNLAMELLVQDARDGATRRVESDPVKGILNARLTTGRGCKWRHGSFSGISDSVTLIAHGGDVPGHEAYVQEALFHPHHFQRNIGAGREV